MGCAGSKPHLLLSSSISTHHHVNSPQKGFILFNANTIEYLKAKEEEIKSKLTERSKQKLIKSNGVGSHVSSKSLFGTTRNKNLLTTNTTTSSLPNGKANEETAATVPVENGNAAPTENATVPNGTLKASGNEFKENAIENAVNYVLKYAINDFDIENFKSSNHLSMKQIRKDIMKKNHSDAAQSKHATTTTATTAPNNTTINSTLNATGSFNYGTLKNSESAFYKLALNTAIDEFGSFIQENFIVINEFKTKSSTSLNKVDEQESGGEKATTAPTSTEEEDALKLKEAIELARQNFYKGKMSMVCASKKGGYVVKEVKENNETETQPKTTVEQPTLAEDNCEEPKPVATLSDSPITPENLNKAKTVTILDPQTNQKSKVAISAKINIEDVDISATFKIIDTKQNNGELTVEVAVEEPVATTAVADTSIGELTANADKVAAQKPSKKRSLLRLSKKESKSDAKAAVATETHKTEEVEQPTAVEVEQPKPKPVSLFSAEQIGEMRADFVKIVNDTLESIDLYTKQVNAFTTSRVEELVAEATKEEKPEEEVKQEVQEEVKQEAQEENKEVAVEEEKKEPEAVQFVFDFDKYVCMFKEMIEKLAKLNEQVNTFNETDYELLCEKASENLCDLCDKLKCNFKSFQECQASLNDEKLNEQSTQLFGQVEQVYKLVNEFPVRFVEAKAVEPKPTSTEVVNNGTQKKSKSKLRSTPSWLKSKSSKQSSTEKKEEKKEKEEENKTPDSMSKKEKKKMEALNGKKSSPFKKIIDIKKEIAISILNVGEVLAKTIDYYSLSSSNTKEDDLKELIKISEQQAAVSKQNNGEQEAKKEETVVEEPTTSAAATAEVVADQTAEVEVTITPPPAEVEVEEVIVEEKKTLEVVEVEHTTVTKVEKEAVELHVNTEAEKEKEQQQTQQQSSSASSLSSPSLSTSSSISASAIIDNQAEPSQVISEVLIGATENMASEVTSESFPVISTDRVLNGDETTTATQERVLTDAKKELIEEQSKDSLEAIEQAKHVQNESPSALRKDISFLVKEIMENQSELNREQLNFEKNSSESSSDILSSSNNEEIADKEDALVEAERKATTDRFVATVIENAAQRLSSELSGECVFRNTASLTTQSASKRISLDEELMYQLEDVDKKVKYMNETCSENEDEDEEEENRRFDDLNNEELDELENERLFHPRTPAKIKSDVRRNELQEEIKQISSVIQDLVQTINVKQQANGDIVLDKYTLNDENASPAASKSSGSGSKRGSISSTNSSSNIPIRHQKILTKQKATDELIGETPKTNESFKSVCSPNISDLVSNENSFNDTPKLNKSTSSKHSRKYRSKLPVKK